MICDEVMCGFGRCGEWFAVDRWGVTPDLIAFAKGVNSGYVPARRRDHQRRHRRDLPRTALPRRAHVLRAPAGVRRARSRRSTPSRRRAHRAGPLRSARRSSAPHSATSPSATPPSARCGGSAASGPSSSCGTRRHARDARAVQRRRGGGGADGRAGGGVQGARRVALHALQPHARRAADRHQRRRGPPGHRRHRRGPRRDGPLRGQLPRRRAHEAPAGRCQSSGCLSPFRNECASTAGIRWSLHDRRVAGGRVCIDRRFPMVAARSLEARRADRSARYFFATTWSATAGRTCSP